MSPDSIMLKHCSICGASFVPKRKTAKFCSHACRQAAYRKRQPPRPAPPPRPLVACTCARCGLVYMANPARTSLYCSQRCKNATWREANRDALLERKRRYREANAERIRQYHAANRESINASKRQYHAAHRDTLNERSRQYREANPHVMRAGYHRYSARKRALPATFTAADWLIALGAFSGCCAVCGRPPGLWHTLAADHWIPITAPDCPGTVPWNMVPLCHGVDGCNNQKNNRPAGEWLIGKFGKKKARAIQQRIETWLKERKDLRHAC